jgi:hypothetical protein
MDAPRIYIDIGDAYAVDPYPTAVWDVTRWDDGARWAGTMPNWTPVDCRVRSVELGGGRASVLDLFDPTTATIAVANDDGWATWAPNAPGPLTVGAWIRVRTDCDTDPLFTGLVRRVVDRYSPGDRPGADIVAVDVLARLGTAGAPDDAPWGAGQTAAERIGAWLDYIGWPAALRDLDPGGPTLTATVGGAPVLDLCSQAAVTAGGHLYADRRGAIVYRGADWLRVNARATVPQAWVSNVPRPAVPGPVNRLSTNQAGLYPAPVDWYANRGTLAYVADPAAPRGQYVRVTKTAEPNASLHAWRQSNMTGTRPVVAAGERPTARFRGRSVAVAGAANGQFFVQAQAISATGSGIGGYFTWYAPIVAPGGPWMDYAVLLPVMPAGVARLEFIIGFQRPGAAAGPLAFDLVAPGLMVNDNGVWYMPGEEPPATPATICATAMAPSGPDIDRVINTATAAGADPAPDPAVTAEETRVDRPSIERWGLASWSTANLGSVDPGQLGVVAQRAVGLRREPRPYLDDLDLSPIADPGAADFCACVEYGDRVLVDYTDPNGWSWSFATHVHGIAQTIVPSGNDNQAAEWTTSLRLDDASFWEPGSAWDYAFWDIDRWAAPA